MFVEEEDFLKFLSLIGRNFVQKFIYWLIGLQVAVLLLFVIGKVLMEDVS